MLKTAKKFLLCITCIFGITCGITATYATLPSGYTQLEYINTDRNAYTELTGFTAQDFDRVTSRARLNGLLDDNGWSTSYPALFASPTNAANCIKKFRFNSGTRNDTAGKIAAVYETAWSENWANSSTGKTMPLNTFTDLDIKLADGEQYIKLDGVVKASDTLSHSCTNTNDILILGDWNASSNSVRSKPQADVEYITFYLGNNVVKNLVAAKRNSDNVAGFYETVTDTFYASASSSPFTAGPVAVTGPSITYVMDGGTNYNNAPTDYTEGTGATINGVPTKSGYTFAGWCTDSTLETCAMTQTIGTSDTGDKTFYAKWTQCTACAATNASCELSVVNNVCTYTTACNSGYGNIQNNGAYNASCTALPTYNITYVMDSGTNYSGAPSTYTEGTGATIDGVPTKAGYVFSGWCTDSTLETCAMTQTIGTSDTGDKTFYAKWTQCTACAATNASCELSVVNNACTYTTTCNSGYSNIQNNGAYNASCSVAVISNITYVMNDGTNYSGAPTEYIEGTGATINGIPTKAGYAFTGWCTDSGLTTCAMTQTIGTADTGNKTFYAKWTAAKFAVTTTNLNANDTFTWTMSATGTFYVDCGADGVLSSSASDITNGNTITRTGTTYATYTCTYSTGGIKTISFDGEATGYNSSTSSAYRYQYAPIAFYQNTKLSSVFGDLSAIFPQRGSGLSNLPRFMQTFYDCTGLTSIPAGLFSGITTGASYMFSNTFQGCTGLTSIPGNLFSGITTSADYLFASTFYGCTGLTSIPADLFSGITTGASYMFSNTFQGCTGLTSIPTGLFSGITTGATQMFYYTFRGCTGLTSIPAGLFSGITTSGYQMFYMTFESCTKLEGYIPPTTFAGLIANGSPAQYQMWYYTFGNTQLVSSCPSGTTQYITGYEGSNTSNYTKWNGKVSCIETTPMAITLNTSGADTGATPSTIYLSYNTGWYSDSAGANAIKSLTTTPTKSGLVFAGFYTGENGTGTQVIDANGDILPNNLTFTNAATSVYAHFATEYNITYVMNDGTNYANAPTTYLEGTGATINGTPTKTGYTFMGWCTDSGLTTCAMSQTISTSATGDKTFYAKWKAVTYNITLNNVVDVPSNYTKVEYLASTGTQYIDTGYTPNETTKFRAKLNMTQPTGSVVIGYYVSTANMFRLFNYNQNIYFDINNSTGGNYTRLNGGTFTNGVTYDFLVGNRYVKNYETNAILLGSEVASPSTWNGTQSIKIFPNSAQGKIYLLQIWDNDTLVRNMIPARRNSDDVLGMYDTVTGNFYTNAGSGTFNVGADVNGLSSITSTYTYGTGTIINTVPTRDGYTFAGWCTDSGLTTCAMSQTISTTDTGDKTFYAKWVDANSSCPPCATTNASCVVSLTNNVCTYTTSCNTGYANIQNNGAYNASCSPNTYNITLNNVSNVPSGYTQLEYIESTGTQYIDTGYEPNNLTNFEIKYMHTNFINNYLANVPYGSTNLPAADKANNGLFRTVPGSTSFNRVAWGDSTSGSNIDLGGAQQLQTWYTDKYLQNEIYINNQKVAISSTNPNTNWQGNNSMRLFARHGGDAYPSAIRVEYAKAWEGSSQIFNLIPARRNSDDVLGMYDTVSGTFFTNSGSGTFVAGPAALGSETRTYTYGAGAIINTVPTRDGYYTFAGWCTDSGLTTCSATQTIGKSDYGDKTFYAKWTQCDACAATNASCELSVTNNMCTYTIACNTGYGNIQNNGAYNASCSAIMYNITYEMDNGTNYNNAPTSYQESIGATIDGIPTKAGYTFAGWCTDSTLETCAMTQTIGTDATGDKTFYAKWTQCNACDPTNASCELSVVNNACTYTTACNTGYENIQNNGAYNASCSAKTYTVSYACGTGATGTAPSNETVSYDASFTSPTNSCTKNGYVFTGWAVNDTNDVVDGTFTWNYDSNKTLTAQWAKFAVTTTDLTGTTPTFVFYLSATGEFIVNCGDGGTLSGSGVSGNTITRTGTTEATYTCTYTTGGVKTVGFDGVATGYNTGTANTNSAIRFGNTYSSATDNTRKLASISGSLSAIFPSLGSGNGLQPMFQNTFAFCTNLSGTIPSHLFSDITDSRQQMFDWTFYGCSNLSGYIPPTAFAGLIANGSPTATDMWSSTFYNTAVAASCASYSGKTQYITGYEGAGTTKWNDKVSCIETTPMEITLDASGADTGASPSNIYVKYDTGSYSDSNGTNAISHITIPTKSGKAFIGFYTKQNATGTQIIDKNGDIISDNLYVIGAPTTLYAHFANGYNITYVMDGGTNYSGAPTAYPEGVGVTIDGIPTKNAYVFAGWCTDSGLTSCAMSQTIGTSATGDKTFYAKWTPATYNIFYETDGGTNYNNAPTTYTYATGATIDGVPTNAGYTFAGWCTDRGLQNCAMSQTITTTDTGDKTFYAKWIDTTTSCVACSATNASCTFDGVVNDACTYTTACDTGYGNIQNNGEYNASCSANTYTVSYACGTGATGAAPANGTATYDASFTPAANTCTKTGYTFVGWMVDGTNDVKPAGTAFNWGYDSDKTLTAKWAKFAVTTTNLNANDTFQFTMSATGTFTVDCGEGGTLTSSANDVTNGNTITRSNTTYATYTCTYSTGGVKIIGFNGTATGYYPNPNDGGYQWNWDDYGKSTLAFQNNTKVASVSGSLTDLFPQLGTESLAQIPRFNNTFCGCSNLTTIPANLFSGLTVGGDLMFSVTFYGCSSLQEIPAGLFSNLRTVTLGMFSRTFEGCTSLQSIPQGLFDNMTTTGSIWYLFQNTFYGCTGIRSIPDGLFSSINSTDPYMFKKTFYGCTNLSGYIPPTTFAGLIANDSPTATDMWDNTFTGTNLATSCAPYPETTQYITGYEGSGTTRWNGRVSCIEPTPREITLNVGTGATAGVPSTVYLLYDTGWYSDSAGTTPITSLTTLPTKSGSLFIGFYTGENGTGTQIIDKDGGFIENKLTIDKTTLYAHFATGYNITYVMNDGTNYTGAPTTYFEGVGATIDGTPTKTGYTFVGWCTDNTLETCAMTQTIETTDSGDKTFYAKWTTSHNITYVMNGGTNYTGAPTVYGEGIGVTIDGKPINPGYFFDGWCTDSELQTCAMTQTIGTDATGDKTFYAKWTAAKFSVTTINLNANDTFAWGMSATGTFTVDCGVDGTLSGTGVSGNTITRSNTTYAIYTCTYSTGGVKTIAFDGTATGYNSSNNNSYTYAPIAFYQNTKLSSISGDLSAMFPYSGSSYSQYPRFMQTFWGCTGLTSISAGLFSGITTGAEKMFWGTFRDCTGLTSIPSGLFSGITTGATYMFSYTFNGCTGLTSIPATLFSGITTGAEGTFSDTFSGCTGLTSIPATLFSNITTGAQNMFSYTFNGCTGLTSIPAGLFSGITTGANYMFYYTFSGCTGLTSIPAGLFSGITTGATYMFSYTFNGCTGLTSIPSGLFSGITTGATYMFAGTFYGCTGLTSIGDGLFSGITTGAESMFGGTFYGCTSLTSIPAELFNGITTGAKNMFNSVFGGCSGLTAIPSGLFSSITTGAESMFTIAFRDCTGLTSIPAGLFSGITTSAYRMFESTFQGCTNLTGYIPPSTFAGLVANGHPTATQMWNNAFPSGIATSCTPYNTQQYITGYEGSNWSTTWNGKVSCIEDYTITYEMNGGTNYENPPTTYTYAIGATIDGMPTKAGYIFDGWCTDSNLTTCATTQTIGTSGYGDKTFYAKWTQCTACAATNASCEVSVVNNVCTYNTYCNDGYYDLTNDGAYNASCSACGGDEYYCLDGVRNTVDAGYYSTGGTSTTHTGQSRCESGYYCANGVRNECPSGYGSSAAGATAQNKCYTSCTTSNIEHSATVIGNDYYGDGSDTCDVENCSNGYTVAGGTPNLTTIIETGAGENSTQNSNTMTFSVDYGTRGTITGKAQCSTRSATYPWYYQSGYKFSSSHFATTLPDDSGKYCYCQLDGYTPDNGSLQNLSSAWVFSNTGSNTSDCAANCASICANYLQGDSAAALAYRDAMFDAVDFEPAMCAANTITINWTGTTQEAIDANEAGQCTYGGNIRTPQSATHVPGKTFTGWRFVAPSGG